MTARCDASDVVMQGPYKYENNQWGSHKARGKYEQCLLTREVGGRVEHGWTWSWPGEDSSVFAYPEIIYGWKPWSGGKPTDARFPLRVSEVRELVLRYSVETQAVGSYNLAPEVWLTSGKSSAYAANPRLITTEIMFWLDYAGAAQPAGRVIARPLLDGTQYELWKADSMGDRGDGRGWVLYSFKSASPRRQGVLNVHTILKYLVDSQRINPAEYVASVEFGNEIVGGQGTTWVKEFTIEAKP